MVQRFPYRFVATEGTHAGTTFIYLASGTVISYRTDTPARYFQTSPPFRFGGERHTTTHEMTPKALARFSAIPLKEATP